MLICVESGISIDRDAPRLEELGEASPALAEEMVLTTAESSPSCRIAMALENLGTRTQSRSCSPSFRR